VRLRVTADDLGLSQAVNEETFDLLRLGLIDSASIIANAPYTGAAIATAQSYAPGAFGVHLNLTQFKPLTGAAGLQPLLNANGEFRYDALAQTPKTSALKRAVYGEWQAQIEYCIARGLKPAHLDSHHHVHLMRGFIPVLKRLQWRYGIKRVRGIDHWDNRQTQSMRSRVRKFFWRMAMRADGTAVNGHVISLLDFKAALESGELRGAPSIEILVHPGNTFDPQFEREVQLLRSGWLNRICELRPEAVRRNPAPAPRSAPSVSS